MGFRFTIDSANIVANLACGKVLSCYDAIFSSYEDYMNFLYFLDTFSQSMYSKQKSVYIQDVRHACDILRERENEIWRNEYRDTQEGKIVIARDKEVLFTLKRLSQIFDRCKIKSLLLPNIGRPGVARNDFMTSEKTLYKLLEWHTGDSCLILQPQEHPYRGVTVLDAFPHFDIALKQTDKWPAVLFWDKNDFAFVPVSCEEELLYLYEMICFERNAMAWLKKHAKMKKESSHYYFHLSDLHFGAKNVMVAERRLETLVKSQIQTLDQNDEIDFIVTGDAVDSPTKSNSLEYTKFSEFLESKSGKPPLCVLGNHDVNRKGLAFGRTNQNIADLISKYPQIQVAEDIKTVFLLFNSNISGNLAEGEIGQEQMAEMGNILDRNPKLCNYRLVAVLHHHVVPVETPEFYGRRWYKKLLPEGFIEKSLRLIDADVFLEWLIRRNVKIVLHGHKHIPFMTEYQGMHIIACGSSTGQVMHKDSRKTYLSYNMLKFNKNTVTCTQFAEELLGAGAKDILSTVIYC